MSTTKEMKTAHKMRDSVLWLLVTAIIVAGVWSNYHYQVIDSSVRVIAWILVTVVMLLIARFTTQGTRAWAFAKDAQAELRKVVWPMRQETIQMTMLVLGLVIVLSLIIWGLDSFLLWAIGLLTGQRG